MVETYTYLSSDELREKQEKGRRFGYVMASHLKAFQSTHDRRVKTTSACLQEFKPTTIYDARPNEGLVEALSDEMEYAKNVSEGLQIAIDAVTPPKP